MTRNNGALCLLAGLAVWAVACSNPDAEKRQHVTRGDQYAAEKRDEFAVVEYASAVQLDPKFGEARQKLAQTYERLGNFQAAFPEYVRAADALPDDRAAQIKATEVLMLAQRYEDARSRIAKVLEKDTRDVDAMLLHASASAALKDTDTAVKEIDAAIALKPDNGKAFVNLGTVQALAGRSAEAEVAFKRAIELEPDSVASRLAFANFLSSAGRAPEAEAELKQALSKEPQNLLANQMLATLYIGTRRVADAEQPLKAVADISKAPAARLALADYYVGAGRPKDATDLLTTLSSDQATFVQAETRLAALDYANGRQQEAHKRLDTVLAKAPNDAAVLSTKARWLASENKLDEALDRAKAAVAADPQSAVAYQALADTQDRRREVSDAIKSYTEVLRLNPRAVEAQVALSRLSITSGDRTAALTAAEAARQLDPRNANVRVTLARSLIMNGNLARAEAEVAQLLRDAPDAAVVQTVSGTLQASKGNAAAARQAYERALQLSPGFLEALGGLTALDIQSKAPAQALARLEPEIAKRPTNAPLLALAAQAHNAAGDPMKAEQALRRAVSVEPRFTQGYAMLADLYIRQKRTDDARAEFEGMVKRDPTAVGAKTMVGVLLEAQGKRDEARKWYEGTVNGTAAAPVAANNLAFIYAEQGTNLDMALQLATTAKQNLPEDPNVDDTIGWVYYKKDLASLAIGPLEESLKKRPDNAEVLYHLGLTHAKLGNKDRARDALARAVKIDPRVGGGDAQRALSSVSQ